MKGEKPNSDHESSGSQSTDRNRSLNRRGLLKKIAATGVIGSSLITSTETTSASSGDDRGCYTLYVKGRSPSEVDEYRITLDGDPPKLSERPLINERSDRIWDHHHIFGEAYNERSGSYVEGKTADVDAYSGSRFKISNVQVDGGVLIRSIFNPQDDWGCSNMIDSYPTAPERIEISGDGKYKIGTWRPGTLTGEKLESGSLKTCQILGDTVKCVWETEGVTTSQIEDPINDHTFEGEFAVGNVGGYQWEDVFKVENGSLETSGPTYLDLEGDLSVDITY